MNEIGVECVWQGTQEGAGQGASDAVRLEFADACTRIMQEKVRMGERMACGLVETQSYGGVCSSLFLYTLF